VSGLLIARAAADAAEGRPVFWLPRFQDAEPVLDGALGEGEVCVLMGAGDIDALTRSLAVGG
jgi:UDP-N-acetylmuramate--alanine ligase